jgi:hypothetical protein
MDDDIETPHSHKCYNLQAAAFSTLNESFQSKRPSPPVSPAFHARLSRTPFTHVFHARLSRTPCLLSRLSLPPFTHALPPLPSLEFLASTATARDDLVVRRGPGSRRVHVAGHTVAGVVRFSHINHRVPCEEPKRHELKAAVDDILHREILGARGVMQAKRVPDHEIFLADVTLLLDPLWQALVGAVAAHELACWVEIEVALALRRHPDADENAILSTPKLSFFPTVYSGEKCSFVRSLLQLTCNSRRTGSVTRRAAPTGLGSAYVTAVQKGGSAPDRGVDEGRTLATEAVRVKDRLVEVLRLDVEARGLTECVLRVGVDLMILQSEIRQTTQQQR